MPAHPICFAWLNILKLNITDQISRFVQSMGITYSSIRMVKATVVASWEFRGSRYEHPNFPYIRLHHKEHTLP